jgi:peptidoglycan hydrolase-like protein with peptidoglycan-binding domain
MEVMMSDRKRRWRLGGASAVIVAVLASIALVPAPASAYNSYTGAEYVKGRWATSSPEGVVNLDTNDESGAACLWQAILWADKAWIADKSRTFSISDIDGLFGWDSHQATRSWQYRHGLSVDDIDLGLKILGDKGLTIITENLRNGDRFVFSGRIHADRITGTVQMHNENQRQIRPWTAIRGS